MQLRSSFMELNELKSLLDFGMAVILWLVQLVIYPSFLTCDPSKLTEWHKTYTQRVAWVIIPMMFPQLPLVAWIAWREPVWNHMLAVLCLIGCWLLTFCVSVPLHRKMDRGATDRETVQRLIQSNWPRTVLWTAAFVFGVL